MEARRVRSPVSWGLVSVRPRERKLSQCEAHRGGPSKVAAASAGPGRGGEAQEGRGWRSGRLVSAGPDSAGPASASEGRAGVFS